MSIDDVDDGRASDDDSVSSVQSEESTLTLQGMITNGLYS
jgi:hypothetical protein